MESVKRPDVTLGWITIILSVLISGVCWYFSNGLTGDLWYLLWIAPIPVLRIALRSTAGVTFFVSFTAYLIGRLSWFAYLVTVATLIPAILFTLILPLIFALVIILTRKVVIRTNAWYAVFAFPVFYTTFEWLMIKFSLDGTAASIAYSQMNCLPLIQIASLTGILGITFMVAFIPSALTFTWHYRNDKNQLKYVASVSLILIASVFLFGVGRLNDKPGRVTQTVGLAVLGENTHKMDKLDFQNELVHTNNYAIEIASLAAKGATIVLLPERAININGANDSSSLKILSRTARENHVSIVTGYTNFKDDKPHNSALVLNDKGDVLVDYDKAHLVNFLEDQFTPGDEIGLFSIDSVKAGVAICKDLDFHEYIKQYGVAGVGVLYVPAWDFVMDDWLHCRMAILRAVEDGFSEVRIARLGRLTICDPYGRINAEVRCTDGKPTSLVGQVSISRVDTFYTRYGDWFGWIVIISAVLINLMMLVKWRKRPTH